MDAGPVELLGEHLLLRELREADRDAFVAELVDPAVWTHTQIEMASRADAEAQLSWLVTQVGRAERSSIYLAVVEDGTFAGIAAVARTGEIGWYLGRRHWRRGLATKATRLLADFAFDVLGLDAVFATCDPDNAGSARVLAKAGFTLDGRLPDRVPTPRGPRSRDRWTCRRAHAVLLDHDFHPDEDTVRLFRTPPAGIVRLDDDVAVYEVRYERDVVLRHYAFADHWFKVNVTTDDRGRLIETGDKASGMFTFNCDIATPMVRDDDTIYGVDLFVDVLIRADTTTYRVTDEDELAAAIDHGLVSRREAAAVADGVAELLGLVEANRLLPWLHEVAPFGPCDPPAALPTKRVPVPDRVQSGIRPTW